MIKLVLRSLVFAGTFGSSAFAGSGGPPSTCQTQGPVTVCNLNDAGGFFTVSYAGYLVGGMKTGSCRPDFVADTDISIQALVNGVATSSNTTTPCANPTRISGGFKGPGDRRPVRIELYLQDSSSRYDSIFGRNYHFNF